MAKEEKQDDGLTFISPVGTATFVHVWEPFAFKQKKGERESEANYSLLLVFKDSAQLKEARKACGRALVKKFGDAVAREGMKKGRFQLPFRKASEYSEYGAPFDDDDADDWVMVGFKTKSPPGIVNERAKPMMKQQDFYAGCLARVSAYAHAFDTNGNKGVTFLLNNVQKTGDGEKLAGARKDAEDEFDAVEGAAGGDDDDLEDLF